MKLLVSLFYTSFTKAFLNVENPYGFSRRTVFLPVTAERQAGGHVKAVLIFILVFACPFLLFAKPKIALLGTDETSGKIADLVLSKNSGDFDFLERRAVDKILKEQKLVSRGFCGKKVLQIGKLLHVDLFAVISTGGEKERKLSKPGIIIFNAKNGFRLLNSSLSGNIEDASGEIGDLLKRAQRKIDNKNLILISFFMVKDVDIPVRFRSKITSFLTLLERRLSAVSDIVILEREYLESVNEERILTGRWHELATSSKLLRFEFVQGKTAEEVNLILRVSTPADKALFRVNKLDCLSEPSEKAREIIREILPGLRISYSESVSFSAKGEAAKLFKEYERLYNNRYNRRIKEKRKEAYAKLFSAIALDPENLSYRLAALPYYPIYRKYSPEEYYNYIIQSADNLCRDFPRASEVYGKILFISDKTVSLYSSNVSPPPPANGLEIARRIVTELRIRYYRETDRKYSGLNWEDGIDSEEEFKFFQERFKKFSYAMYLDPETFSTDAAKILEVYFKYLGKMKNSADPGFWQYYKVSDIFAWWLRGFDDSISLNHSKSQFSPETIALVIKKSDRSISFLEKCSDKDFQRNGEVLHIFRNYLIYPANKKEFFGRLKAWLKLNYNISRFYDYKLFKICCELLSESDKRHVQAICYSFRKAPAGKTVEVLSSWEQFIAKCKVEHNLTETAKIITENPDLISQYKKELSTFIFDKANSFFSIYSSCPCNNSAETFLEAVRVLCPDWKIEVLVRSKLREIWRSGIYKGKLFFTKSETRGIFCFDLQNRSVTKFLPGWQTGFRVEEMAFYKDKLIVCGIRFSPLENVISVIPLNGGKPKLIRDLPVRQARFLRVMNARIYILSWKGVLFSCDLSGLNRKIEISPNREEQLNILDSKAGSLQTMLVDPVRNCLLFGGAINCHFNPDQGLYEYFPATGKTNFIPHNDGSMWLVGIFPPDGGNGKLEPIDLFKDSAEFIRKSAANSSGSRYLLYYGRWRPNHNVQMQPGQFWGPQRQGQGWKLGQYLQYWDNGEIKVIDIPFMRSNRAEIYPHPDGISFIVICNRTVFKIAGKIKNTPGK